MFIKVQYEEPKTSYEIQKLFKSLPDTIACDFEVASKFTKKEKDLMLLQSPTREINQMVLSDGLAHPALTVITHLSIATSPTQGYVIVCKNDYIRSIVYQFLINTNKLQLWYNCCYDFKHILFNTNSLPKNYEDVFLLHKCLNNNADNYKCLAGLKQLEGHNYGAWGISDELEFSLENMYNEKMIEYAAIDACATYNRWLYLTNLNDEFIYPMNINEECPF